MDKLRECPFCGYEKIQITTKRSGNNVRTGDLKQAMCSKCKARGPIFGSRYEKIPSWYHVNTTRSPQDAESLAIAAWNRRTPYDTLTAERDWAVEENQGLKDIIRDILFDFSDAGCVCYCSNEGDLCMQCNGKTHFEFVGLQREG